MKISVFGAAGFVGRNVVSRLVREDFSFVASDIVESPFNSKVDYVKTDIQVYDQVESLVEGSDYVFHLAASPLVSSLSDPKANMRINIEGTLNILDACRRKGVDNVLFSSASSVIGEVIENPVSEDHSCKPKTPYAIAKKTCEDYLRVYHELFGINYLIFRFFNVYGPWQYPSSGALIPLIYNKLKSGKPLTVYGDGSASRDFIFVEDIVDFIFDALNKNINNILLNMGTGKPTTIIELAEIFSKIIGIVPEFDFRPKRPGEIDNFLADTSKLEEMFGKLPNTSLETGLRLTNSWLNGIT
jgi:UDP-glucose 4-epimerase